MRGMDPQTHPRNPRRPTTTDRMVTQTSLEAYEEIKPRLGKLHQQILGILSDGRSRSREEIREAVGWGGSTLRPRIVELKHLGVLDVVGYGKNANGRRVELIGLR